MNRSASSSRPTPSRPAIAVSWALTLAASMWAVGYLLRLPFIHAPYLLLLIALAACLLAGGWALGRWSAHGSPALAAGVGLLCVLPNLMMFGAVLADLRNDDRISRPLLWMVLFVLAATLISMALVTTGWSLARRAGPPAARPVRPDWLLAFTAALTAALLVVSGGMVTGSDAGLAVPDWPASFQHNMFFFPLSRMAGSIYYEHSHRLIGTLVGLMCICLCLFQFTGRAPRWRKTLALALLLAVVAQGILGGLRVTEARMAPQGIAVAGPEHETALSATLRVLHGICGQLVLAALAALATTSSDTWQRLGPAPADRRPSFDRHLGTWLIAALLVQLVFGALLRHGRSTMLLIHISFAVVALAMSLVAGLRAWGLYETVRPVHRTGLLLSLGSALQVLLGLAALAVFNRNCPLGAAITTAHQAVGAALLVLAVVQTLWFARLTRSPAPT